MKENRVFYCYSKPLKDYLIANGTKYLTKSKHFKTEKSYWVFVGDEKLNNLLQVWRTRKN